MMSSSRSKYLLLAILSIVFISSSASSAPPAGGDWQLVWSDEFDSGSTPIPPDSANWGYENGYKRNKEEQYYTNDIQNAYCQDGFLNIEAHKHPPGTYPSGSEPGQDGSISSTSLRSIGKVAYKFGYFEIRARIDTQLGSWPAFWTLGVSGEWPDGGECDIMEYYTGKFLFNVAWWKTGDARWSARWDGEKVFLTSLPPGWLNEFHNWAMEWNTNEVKLYLDEVLINQWNSSQDDNGGGDVSVEGFQQAHYMLINQAIGGTAGGNTSSMVFPTTYEVDWVRIWQEDTSSAPTIVDNDDASIAYSGTWGTWVGNPGYMGTEHFSETAGSTATFTFTGTGATYYGFLRDDLGDAEILLDGSLVDTIDCYSGTSQYFYPLYQTPVLAYGEHTLAVRVKGTQNPSSSGIEIIVDAFGFSQTPSQGDINDDGVVNNVDFSIVQGQWQNIDCGDCGGADLTGDNDVSMDDVLIVGQNWTNDYTLKGYWALDGDASDSSWYGLSSTVTGCVWDPNGRIDGAVSLDGIDDKIKIDDYYGVLGGQSRTTCAWIKTDQVLGEIITWGDSIAAGGKWSMRNGPSGLLDVQVGGGKIFGTTFIADGAWHHVAAVLDNDSSPNLNEIKLYVDGVEEAVPGTSVALNTLYSVKVKIGVFGATEKYFQGLIDDVRIYDRALTEAEIQNLAGMGD